MKLGSLNDIDKQIAALKAACAESSESDEESESGLEDPASDDNSSFSGYSCDSSSSDESESAESDGGNDLGGHPDSSTKVDYDKKANQIARKKARFGMSSICFKHLLKKCVIPNCIYRHVEELSSLTEEERGEVVRELQKRPYDDALGLLVKGLNVPICKAFTKTGECKFRASNKCRFWHIDSENTAKWAGCHFWCESCRKAFTSDSQLREHNGGKFHKQMVARR